jgi:Putative lumazine-binding
VNNSPAKAVSQQYYDAIRNHDAAKAYSYLDPTMKLTFQGQSQQINEQTFAQVLQAYDQAKGPVSDYSITSTNISTSTSTGNTANVTVRVTRSGNSYDVHLQLRQEGNDWKILSFDGI